MPVSSLHSPSPSRVSSPRFRSAMGMLPPLPSCNLEGHILTRESLDLIPSVEDANNVAAPCMSKLVPNDPQSWCFQYVRVPGFWPSQCLCEFPSPNHSSSEWMHHIQEESFPTGSVISLQVPPSHDEYAAMRLGRYSTTYSRLSGNSCGRKGKGRERPIVNEEHAWEIVRLADGAPEERIWYFANKSAETSAALQRAMEIIADKGKWDIATNLVNAFGGHIKHAYESPHGNYALARLFEVMPTCLVSNIAQELRNVAVDAAKHQFGCRCMIRLVRHHANSRNEDIAKVICALLSDVVALGRSQFGFHVVQELLTKGLPEHRRDVVNALKGNLLHESKHRFAYRVIAQGFQSCEPDVVKTMFDEISNHKDGVRQLIDSEFGMKVVRSILHGPQRKEIAEHICSISSLIKHRPILQDAERIMGVASLARSR